MTAKSEKTDKTNDVFLRVREMFGDGSPRKVRSGVKPFSTVIEFDITGPTPQAFHLTISDQGERAQSGPHLKPDVVVSGPSEAFLPVLTGDVSISQKIATGDVTFTGAYLSLMRLEKSILANRRRS